MRVTCKMRVITVILIAGWTHRAAAAAASALSTYHLNGASNSAIHIEQEFSDAEEGSVIWDCSRCFLAYVERSAQPRGRRVIEIGSGTGFVGLGLARLGATSVVLTDKPSQIPLLLRNVEHNRGPSEGGDSEWIAGVEVAPLSWGKGWSAEAPRLGLRDAFDWVVCCDCVYPGVSPEPLITTLLELLESNPDATILLACEYRPPPAASPEGLDNVRDFFERMRHECLVEQVADQDQHPQWRCDEVTIWRMTRRKLRVSE